MKRSFLFISAILLLSVFLSATAHAQRIYIKIWDDGNNILTGSTTTTGYLNQTEISSFGQENSSCAGTTPSCIPVVGNFIFNMIPDQTITDYRRALLQRRVWRKVEISLTRMNPGNGTQSITYEKITLQDVFVTGLTHSANEGEYGTFQVKLDPVKITWAFTASDYQTGVPGATRTFSWDRSTNSSF